MCCMEQSGCGLTKGVTLPVLLVPGCVHPISGVSELHLLRLPTAMGGSHPVPLGLLVSLPG